MSSLNFRTSQFTERNAAGTPVRAVSNEAQLTRMTLAHMLWEDNFYVDGATSADTVASLVKYIASKPAGASFVANLAIKARNQFKMRHIPLLLARELARSHALSADTLNSVIMRPDEMSEFLSIYWKDGKVPLSNQVKKGLSSAFKKFNEYSLAKWDKNSAAVSLRDVMFLTHPKPDNDEQASLFKRVANKELAIPDTWETQLSAGADKKETFERLMAEGKLGSLAFLRNLRNMRDAGISDVVIRAYSENLNVDRVLPFRFIAAARIVPQLEDMLEQMMFRALEKLPKLKGKTKLYVDVSSSMYTPKVSEKSDITRQDASLALAMLCREICEEVEIYSFSGSAIRIAPRRGFALADAIQTSQGCSGTSMFFSLATTKSPADRIICITDEQTYDTASATPRALGADKGYILDVGNYANGVNHDAWVSITGFSEAVLDYIRQVEEQE